MRLLVYGYGNPGRLDDGLGPALVAELAARRAGERATLATARFIGSLLLVVETMRFAMVTWSFSSTR